MSELCGPLEVARRCDAPSALYPAHPLGGVTPQEGRLADREDEGIVSRAKVLGGLTTFGCCQSDVPLDRLLYLILGELDLTSYPILNGQYLDDVWVEVGTIHLSRSVRG